MITDLSSQKAPLLIIWWSLFVHLAAGKHREAITSRPLLLYGVARQTKHAGQTTLTISNNHAKSSAVISLLQELNTFFKYLKIIAEQLQVDQRMALIAKKAFIIFLPKPEVHRCYRHQFSRSTAVFKIKGVGVKFYDLSFKY